MSLSNAILLLFLLSLFLPITFRLGPLFLTPYRALLILTFLPLFVLWLTGAAGQIRKPDIFLLASCLWATVAFTINHGLVIALEPAGILLVETFGTYLLARVTIRDPLSFRFATITFITLVILSLPFALYESATANPLLLTLFAKFFTVPPNVPMEFRWGFDRAQGPFEHPILYGVVCSAAFGLCYYVTSKSVFSILSVTKLISVVLAVGCSLSSGAFVSVSTQSILILWDTSTKRLRNRWFIFIALCVAAYVIVDLISNRSPFDVFISYLTFSQHNSYNRILIWQYGTAEVYRYPFFGMGLDIWNWSRPWWMHASMDNFWLVYSLRNGLPSTLFFVLAVLFIYWSVTTHPLKEQLLISYRLGALTALTGIIVSTCTVHLWNNSYCVFIFLLGSILWILDVDVRTGDNLRDRRRPLIDETRSLTSTDSLKL